MNEARSTALPSTTGETMKTDYNTFLEDYDAQTKNVEHETRNAFYRHLPELHGKDILDVGCGSGHDALHFNNLGARVSGIDVSARSIEAARANVNGTFLVADMHALPFADNTFDVVTSWYALQAATDTERVLSEMVRVAKPGGTIVYLAKHPIRSMLEGYVNDGLENYFSKETVTSKIFSGKITLREPNHQLVDYFSQEMLQRARLEAFEEGMDFPASQNTLPSLRYPTYLIMRWRKLEARAEGGGYDANH